MKTFFSISFLFIISFNCFTQNKFELKIPNIEALKSLKNNDSENQDILIIYLENNYKSTTKKYEIKNDSDFADNPECGFKKNYEFEIIFSTNSCGEASPLKKTISFPKTKNRILRKFIENIYMADLYENNKPINKWTKDKNEYTPGKNEVGCYYKIIQTKNKSIIDVFCGC